MKIVATTHSLEGIIGRLGVDPLEANRFLEKWLKTARVVTYREATQVVSIFKPNKNDVYYVAPDPLLPNKQVVLIVREGVIVTVMTQLTNALYGVEGACINGVRVIKTLGGDYIEDDTGWVRHLRKERRRKYKKSS